MSDSTNRPGRARRALLKLGLLPLLAPLTAAPAEQLPSGRDILDRVEKLLWGKTVQGDYEMTVSTPRWQRTLVLKAWIERPRRSFVRIVAPVKEAGIGSLRIGTEMWNYLPNVERIIKIPPSMMLQPWMGSDFTNDDLVKESSILEDYTHEVIGTVLLDGDTLVQVAATPRPEAAVVWGRIVYTVRRRDWMPLKQEFFSERGELVRVMTLGDVRQVGGRLLPTRWEMRPIAKPGNLTRMIVKDAVFDQPIDDDIFTQRHLQKR